MKSKAIVWGSGKSAYTVANYLKAEFADSIDFVGFYVSDHQHINKAGDDPIYTINEVVSNSNVIADILLDVLYLQRDFQISLTS